MKSALDSRTTLARNLGVLGACGAALFVVILVTLHLLRPDLGFASDYVSDYANGPYGGWFAAALLAHGLGNLALATGLGLGVAPSRRGLVGSALLAVAAVGILVAAVFATDPEGALPTTAGRIHSLAAAAAFPVEVVALVLLARAFAASRRWSRLTSAAAGVAGLALAWLAVAVARGGAPGIPERTVLAVLAVWELSAAVRLALLRVPSGPVMEPSRDA